MLFDILIFGIITALGLGIVNTLLYWRLKTHNGYTIIQMKELCNNYTACVHHIIVSIISLMWFDSYHVLIKKLIMQENIESEYSTLYEPLIKYTGIFSMGYFAYDFLSNYLIHKKKEIYVHHITAMIMIIYSLYNKFMTVYIFCAHLFEISSIFLCLILNNKIKESSQNKIKKSSIYSIFIQVAFVISFLIIRLIIILCYLNMLYKTYEYWIQFSINNIIYMVSIILIGAVMNIYWSFAIIKKIIYKRRV